MNKDAILCVVAPDTLVAANAVSFRDYVREALDETHKSIDLNFSETRFIDSSGCGVLVFLNKTLLERGGQLRLIAPISSVLQMLELTRLHRVFDIVENPQQVSA